MIGRTVCLEPMESAPKDGRTILVWCRHWNHKYATDDDDRARWEGWVITSWTLHNGGGWTWHGHAGEFLGWTALGVPELTKPAGMERSDISAGVPTPPQVDGKDS